MANQIMKEKVTNLANWINSNIVGNPWTFVLAIVLVVLVYLAIPVVGGYATWNAGLGLFFNTASSSFELITGIGAVVGVVGLHQKDKAQKKSLNALHDKIDNLNNTKKKK